MRIRDQVMSDINTFKRLDNNKKWLFIWDYYRVPIIAALIVIAILVLLVIGITRDDAALYVVMVNADNEVESAVISDLLEEGGAQLEERDVDVETNYRLKYDDFTEEDVQTVEVLGVRFGIGDLDVFVADEDVFESYATKDAFIDLSLFISDELLHSNEADLYRYENADGHEIVGGLWLREGSPLHKAGYYYGDVLIGVVSLAQNLDNALLLVQQLLV